MTGISTVKLMDKNKNITNPVNNLEKAISDEPILHFLLEKCNMTLEDAESEIEDMNNQR